MNTGMFLFSPFCYLMLFPLQSVEKNAVFDIQCIFDITCTCFNVVCCTITTKNQLISFKLICIHCKNKALCVIRKGVKWGFSYHQTRLAQTDLFLINKQWFWIINCSVCVFQTYYKSIYSSKNSKSIQIIISIFGNKNTVLVG